MSSRTIPNPNTPFRSERLIYRAAESPDDDEFFIEIGQEPVGFINSNSSVAKPQSRQDCKAFQNYIEKDALLGVMICLAREEEEEDNTDEKDTCTSNTTVTEASKGQKARSKLPKPIGVMHLNPFHVRGAHHRHTPVGIDIAKGYQGRGYGSEALNWMLGWAFNTAGLHRVDIEAFEYNYGARKLYERLGFKPEGVKREAVYQYGQWWDNHSFGILEREWREMQERKEKEKGKAPS